MVLLAPCRRWSESDISWLLGIGQLRMILRPLPDGPVLTVALCGLLDNQRTGQVVFLWRVELRWASLSGVYGPLRIRVERRKVVGVQLRLHIDFSPFVYLHLWLGLPHLWLMDIVLIMSLLRSSEICSDLWVAGTVCSRL